MGTHPIFESDFDCLTEMSPNDDDGEDESSSSRVRELKQIQTMVRPLESLSTTQSLIRGAVEAAIVGLGPPLSLLNRSLVLNIILMNKLVPAGINRRLNQPETFGLDRTANVLFGGSVHGWARETCAKRVKGNILYIHGSGGNRAWPGYRVTMVAVLNLLGFNVLSVDLTGYGETNDRMPSQAQLDSDILASIAYLHELWPSQETPRLLWAHSLATGLISSALRDSSFCASRLDGIILEAPIKSLTDCMRSSPLAQKLQRLWTRRIFHRMLAFHVQRSNFDLDTENDILTLNTHLLILAAEDDESVDWKTSHHHFSRLSTLGTCKSARFILFEHWHNYGHDGAPIYPGMGMILDDFLDTISNSLNNQPIVRFQADVM